MQPREDSPPVHSTSTSGEAPAAVDDALSWLGQDSIDDFIEAFIDDFVEAFIDDLVEAFNFIQNSACSDIYGILYS